MFDKLLKTAVKALENVSETPKGCPMPQAAALLASSGKIYTAVNDLSGDICSGLRENGEEKLEKIVTVWKNGSVDLPSLEFRRALCAWRESSLNTEIMFTAGGERLIKPLRATMPL